jgi:DNA polymerase III epsilon subunit-like protein
MKLNLKKPLAFFDLETTGVDVARDRIVEIAVVKVIDLNGKILINKQFSGLIKNVNNIRRLDLAGIRSGAYVLQVISGSVSTTKRFTIL